MNDGNLSLDVGKALALKFNGRRTSACIAQYGDW